MHPIARYRLARGMTQTQLGQAVGVSLTSVQGWELRGSRPHPNRLAKLAEVLGVEPLVLLDEIAAWQARQAGQGKNVAA